MSIDSSRLDRAFRRKGVSCVLASYGVVANYFTRTPIIDFFQAYCDHFGRSVSPPQTAESEYANHFDDEHRRRRLAGYKIIKDLHDNSPESEFVSSQACFSATFYDIGQYNIARLRSALRNGTALLNITYPCAGGCHSVTVAHDGGGFIYVNTTAPDNPPPDPLLGDSSALRDVMLYEKL